jgi:5-methylcytosine-specific restriction endonuclease McrA
VNKKILDRENRKLFDPAFTKFYGRAWEPRDRKRNPQTLARRIALKLDLSTANLTKKRARAILLDFVGHMPLVEAPRVVVVKTKQAKPQKLTPRIVKQKPNGRKPNAFYDSREWFALRYQVLKLYKACCQCCGRSRRDGIIIHVDHIKPRHDYPELELELSNLQVLCNECNLGKSNVDNTDWRTA